MIKAILTDIEGTTSSISFVKDTLFPYAYERIDAFVQMFGQSSQVKQIVSEAKMAAGNPSMSDADIVTQLKQWITDDKKVTALKTLQGLIWAHGYKSGAFTAHMYPDTTISLQSWHNMGLPIYVYSSGSVNAQKLFFTYSDDGDVTPLLSGFFDTNTGPKNSPDSYKRIAADIGIEPEHVLFLSDIATELDAAKTAGMQTYWVVREQSTDKISEHRMVSSLADITL